MRAVAALEASADLSIFPGSGLSFHLVRVNSVSRQRTSTSSTGFFPVHALSPPRDQMF